MSSKCSRRLTNEFQRLSTFPVCNEKLIQVGSLYKWRIILPGPQGSAYEEGTFNLSFIFPDRYPFKSPEVKFITPIYHPNIKKDTGEIDDNLFAKWWSPTQKVRDIIEKLASILKTPSTESPLEPEIAQEFLDDKNKWEKKVRDFVKNNRGK